MQWATNASSLSKLVVYEGCYKTATSIAIMSDERNTIRQNTIEIKKKAGYEVLQEMKGLSEDKPIQRGVRKGVSKGG